MCEHLGLAAKGGYCAIGLQHEHLVHIGKHVRAIGDDNHRHAPLFEGGNCLDERLLGVSVEIGIVE